MLFRLMRMAVQHEAESLAVFQLLQPPFVVAVGERDLDAFYFHHAPTLVQLGPDGVDRLPKLRSLYVAVAERKVRGEALEQPDRVRIFNVAAVDDKVDLPLLHQLQGLLHGRVTAVRVAQDGDFHGFTRRSLTGRRSP